VFELVRYGRYGSGAFSQSGDFLLRAKLSISFWISIGQVSAHYGVSLAPGQMDPSPFSFSSFSAEIRGVACRDRKEWRS
jgi:hypothetical protein